MDKRIMNDFLVYCTVPIKKNDDRIYDCVWRAHRDVLAGRFYLVKYQNASDDMVDYLCEVIKNYKKCKIQLTSLALIHKLKKEYASVEFGAIQKLVNLSLKYLLVLKEFEGLNIKIDEKNCDCPLDSHIFAELKKDAWKLKKAKQVSDEKLIDSLIKEKFKWTSKDFTEKQYNYIQNFISGLADAKGGNIFFDFKRWK